MDIHLDRVKEIQDIQFVTMMENMLKHTRLRTVMVDTYSLSYHKAFSWGAVSFSNSWMETRNK